jgi:hypothetical protein
LDGEVGINDHFAGGPQPVLTFGCGFKGFCRGRKPLSLTRSDAGQFDLNSSDGIGCHDDAVKLLVADVLAASVSRQPRPASRSTLRELGIESGATIVEIRRVWYMDRTEDFVVKRTRSHSEGGVFTGMTVASAPEGLDSRLERPLLRARNRILTVFAFDERFIGRSDGAGSGLTPLAGHD